MAEAIAEILEKTHMQVNWGCSREESGPECCALKIAKLAARGKPFEGVTAWSPPSEDQFSVTVYDRTALWKK